MNQGIPQQQGTDQIARLIVFVPATLFSKMKMSKWKQNMAFFYILVLQDPPFYFRMITSYLKMSGMPCMNPTKNWGWAVSAPLPLRYPY